MVTSISLHVKLLIVGFAFFAFTPSVTESSATKDFPFSCEIENDTFEAGEELVYRLYYNLNFIWIKAGEVTFTVKETEDRYIYKVIGDTYPSYEWFYQVHDIYRTEVDKTTLLPITSERILQEGGYRLYEHVTYDQENGQANVISGRSRETAEHKGEFDIGCSHDMIALLFRLRNMDKDHLVSSGRVPLKFFLNRKSYNLGLSYLRMEEKKVRGLGKFKSVLVSPDVISGSVFKEGDQLKAWISDDENKVPLMIESPVVVGSVKAVLKSHNGLKYDLDSQL